MSDMLLRDRRFAPLFLCQFLSALGDNILRNAIGIAVLWSARSSDATMIVPLAALMFVAPCILLSSIAGTLADRSDKAALAGRLKLADLAAACLAALGLYTGSETMLFAALMGAGSVSALFFPVKYGMLPDQLPPERLPGANALIEGATFLAIIAGTGAGAMLIRPLGAGGVGLLVIALALAAWLAAKAMPAARPHAPDLRLDYNLLRGTRDLLRANYAEPRIWRPTLANAWFWMAGGAVLSLTPSLVHDNLHGSANLEALFACVFAVGIAAGSGAASYLCGGRIVPLITVFGALMMGGSLCDLWHLLHHAPHITIPHVIADLFLAAFGAGLIAVPSMADVQIRAPDHARARIVAAMNVMSSVGVALGSCLLILGGKAGLGTASLLGLTGIASAIAALVLLAALVRNPAGDLVWIIFRLAFRVTLRGGAYLPKSGQPSVLIANHISWLDAALLLAAMEEAPAFAIDSGVALRWWVRPAVRLLRAIPVDPFKPHSMRRILDAVRMGRTAVIFPEGRITITGSLMMMQGGAAMIAQKADAPLIPARIEGLERSYLSRLDATQTSRAIFPKVTLTVLPPTTLPVPADLTGRARREAVLRGLTDMMANMMFETTTIDLTLMASMRRAARSVGMRREAVADPIRGSFSYRKLLAGANAYGAVFQHYAPVGGKIGIMLPNAAATLIALLGLSSAGLVPVMLNPRGGLATLEPAMRATGLTRIITARALVERLKLQELVARLTEQGASFVYLEDIALSQPARLRALLRGGRSLVERQPSDAAVIFMTSGSSGTPKAVVLSHRNILGNMAQVAAVIDFGRRDTVLNAMPLFHAFGLSSATLLPLAAGAKVFFYPNPLDYQGVPIAAYGLNATVMFVTQVFAEGYLRRAHPLAFRSVRFVIGGASKFRDSTIAAWNEKFGLRILVGYGLTETAPVIAMNTPTSNRFGTAGRIVPGIETRLVPVDGIKADGVLHVRGPNIMLGMMQSAQPGMVQPLADGWFDTGDVVDIDPDGHVRIVDRIGRFAKIGGEKISLDLVEQLAAGAWPGTASAAVAIPDDRKGERIIVLTEYTAADRESFLSHARKAGAPELAIPAYIRIIDRIPMLGSGKPDLAALKQIAAAP